MISVNNSLFPKNDCANSKTRCQGGLEKSYGGRAAVLDLGRVCHSARATLNGRDLGCRFMPPYRFDVPRGVLRGRNELCVEVTGTGANRLRWNDRTGVKWKIFHDTNMLSVKGVWRGKPMPLDASDWPVAENGLLGPVVLRCWK